MTIRQYLAAFICTVRGHDWPRWRRHRETRQFMRTCKRCGRVEADGIRTAYARRLRNENPADTIQRTP